MLIAMRFLRKFFPSIFLAVVPLGLVAQQPVSATGTGTVTGHVTCGDTQRPARFATVTLFGVPAEVTTQPKLDPNADEAAQMAAMKVAMAAISKTTIATGQTDMSGAYTVSDVEPGDYYVFGAAAGYVSPLNEVQALLDGGADPKKPLPGIPVVHVVAEHTAAGDVTVERGAAVSGNVMWDDGAPVTGATISVVAKGEAKEPPSQFAMLAMSGGLIALLSVSDDQGHFRVAGLAPGEYVISARLPSKNAMNMVGGKFNVSKALIQKPVVVYAPAAFHKADGKTLTLHAGEDVRDQIVTVNLGETRSVSGRVGSAEDHHGLNSAHVTLTDAGDTDFVRSATVDSAGNFTVIFVPPGTYNLTVTDAADTEPEKKDDKKKTSLLNFSSERTVKSYEDGKQTLIVSDSDVAGLSIELTPSKTVKKDMDFGAILGGDDTSSKP
jgi:hypothetical protein